LGQKRWREKKTIGKIGNRADESITGDLLEENQETQFSGAWRKKTTPQQKTPQPKKHTALRSKKEKRGKRESRKKQIATGGCCQRGVDRTRNAETPQIGGACAGPGVGERGEKTQRAAQRRINKGRGKKNYQGDEESDMAHAEGGSQIKSKRPAAGTKKRGTGGHSVWVVTSRQVKWGEGESMDRCKEPGFLIQKEQGGGSLEKAELHKKSRKRGRELKKNSYAKQSYACGAVTGGIKKSEHRERRKKGERGEKEEEIKEKIDVFPNGCAAGRGGHKFNASAGVGVLRKGGLGGTSG